MWQAVPKTTPTSMLIIIEKKAQLKDSLDF
jgi:hypothetical protein